MSDEQHTLTHLDDQGNANMVDVGAKADTTRIAVAEGYIRMSADAFAQIKAGSLKKGDVHAVARIAGILGAKQTSALIPLCHPIMLTKVDVSIELEEASSSVRVVATTHTVGKTGVEMEALTAVSVAALTIYDMAKAVDRTMRIEGIRLLEKQGGKSGYFRAEDVQ